MGAAAIPLILTAVSTAATVYNQRQTAKRQDNQLASQLRAQAQKQKEADAKTAQLVAQRANSTDADEKAGALAQYTQALQQKQAQAAQPLATVGAISDAYKQAGSDAALGIANYAGNRANLTASMDAPLLQRQNDAYDENRYKTDIGLIGRRSSGDDYLAQMKLRSIQPNPWINAGAQLLQGYASSMGGGGGSSMGGGGTSNVAADSPMFGQGGAPGWWNGYGYTTNKPPPYLG